jgi:hypothetical protein
LAAAVVAAVQCLVALTPVVLLVLSLELLAIPLPRLSMVQVVAVVVLVEQQAALVAMVGLD